ncbi:MAG: hypothetical protein J5822_08530 [Eubacteriaceae bacterium]|nr:hypothetical protein [Eubacteriaceae bacterium]
MSIEYAIDYDGDGQLTVYRGEFRNPDTVLYRIEKGTVIGEDSYYIRSVPDKRIVYTAVPDPSYPGSFRVYEGGENTYDSTVAFFYHATEPYDIIRKGENVFGEELYILRPGKASKYVIEKRETLSAAGAEGPGAQSGPGRASSGGDAAGSSGIFSIILVVLGIAAFFAWSGFNAVVFLVLLPVIGFAIGTRIKNRMLHDKAAKEYAAGVRSGTESSGDRAASPGNGADQPAETSQEEKKYIHTCPSCGAKSRFPKGIGKISYKCPKCGSVNEADTGKEKQ